MKFEVTTDELKARRLSILSAREKNREKKNPKNNGVFDQKTEDECNLKLRELNSLIQGIPNPDTHPEAYREHVEDEAQSAERATTEKIREKAVAAAEAEAQKILDKASLDAQKMIDDATKIAAGEKKAEVPQDDEDEKAPKKGGKTGGKKSANDMLS